METIARAGVHRSRQGAPERYPWSTMQVGDKHYIPVDCGVQPESVLRAVMRKNRMARDTGDPRRFTMMPLVVTLADGTRAWQLIRMADGFGDRPAMPAPTGPALQPAGSVAHGPTTSGEEGIV